MVREATPSQDQHRPAVPAEPGPPAPWRRRRRWELLAFLELAGLCGLAITQPLLDLIGRSPDFLLMERVDTLDVVLLAVAIALVPPVALWGLGAASGLAGRQWRRAVHILVVTGLGVALAVQVGKQLTGVRGLPMAVAAVLAGLVGTVLYLRLRVLGKILRVASVGPLLSAGLFLFASPASALVLPQSTPAPQAGPATAAKRPPILVFALDELPLASLLDERGKIDAYTFPNLAWLAERSTWYRNATGTTQWTRDAFPSMLTGRWPSQPLAAHYRNYPYNLFTLLGGSYQMNVHESATRLCPPRDCGGPDDGSAAEAGGGLAGVLGRSGELLGELVSPSDPQQEPSADIEQQDAEPVTDAAGRQVTRPAGFAEFLDRLRPSDTPTLHYIHLVIPHRPWLYLPSGARYPSPPGTLGVPKAGAVWEDEPTWRALGRQRHWLQLAYADRLVGETLTTMRDRGLLEEALVVLTADHGMSFAPGTAARILGRGNDPWLMWVPLFVKEPGQQAAKIDDRNWQHVDLLPTLADYAGVKLPWPVDGRSALRGEPRTETSKRFVAVRERGQAKQFTVQGPPNLAAVLKGGGLPARPEARPRLGAEPGRGLDRLVPRPDLVGRPLADLGVTGGGPAVTVEELAAYGNVRPDRGQVPAYLRGTAPSGLAPGTLLAVALNGRVATVAKVAPEGAQGTLRFAGMLPDTAFVAGDNRLEILALEGQGLRRLTLRPAG
jgi:sulfatase-like protein